MQYTGNYNLKKPEGTDVVNIQDLNDNANIIDQKLKEVEGKANNAPANSVNDAAIGSRTPDQAQAPASPGTGTLTQIVSWLTNRIKAITGKVNWWDAPDTTLAGAKGHMDATSAHSATSAATASRIMTRDAYGRAKVAAPSAADDIARKAEVDTVQGDFTSHLSDYTLQIPYVTATGSANIYSVLLNGVTSYYEGMAVAMKINVDNTGASTININGLGAKPIKKPNGNDISAGNLKAGSIYSMRYNGVNFILQGSDTAGDAIPEDVLSGKTFSNDEGEQTGSMPNRGAVVITPGTSNQTIAAGYHNGSGYVKGDANLIAGNIAIEKSIFGVNGNLIQIPDDILYYLGYEQISFVLSYQSGGQYSFTKESNYLYLYQGNNFGEANITTNSAIDFSNIFGVIVLWENKGSTSAGSSGLYLSTSKTGRYDNYIGRIGKSSDFTLTGNYLDTTSYNSSYYVKFYSQTSESYKNSYLKIYKIILLKNFS